MFDKKINHSHTYIYFILLLVFSGCADSEETEFLNSLDFKVINNINPPPTPYSILFISLKIDNNGTDSEIVTDNMTGKLIYERHYKKMFENYPEFLKQNRDNKIRVESDYLDEISLTWEVDNSDSIHDDYKRLDFDSFSNKYLLEANNKHWELSFRSIDGLSIESEISLMSIMFHNNYYIAEDCVIGHYYYIKHRIENSETDQQ
ncbi:MAG: hypothetical protein IPM56_00285 [Ignavibacteriales bacterium]|nr:MAG: hypothetical protein IPM56_00285 [Ignavibacteriales bacterium]